MPPSVLTATHSYPAEEISAMTTFYDGKNCVITRNAAVVHWAHILDASLTSSNIRLQWMLQRNLRQNRHLTHAAEVRENVIPYPTTHALIDAPQALATLFVHEDVLARTLAFELDLQRWRRAELQAGRGDPGRPRYQDVFDPSVPTVHRWHCNDSTLRRPNQLYASSDCPGVYPNSANPFPEIPTLLSIPFSVLHNLPRLVSMVPRSEHHVDLVTMAYHVFFLWSWDPSPEELNQSQTIAAATGGAGRRRPRPKPVHHTTRQNTTFISMLPQETSGSTSTSLTTHRLAPDKSTFELPSGEILFRTSPFVSWEDGDGLKFTASNDLQPKTNSIRLDPLHWAVEEDPGLIYELNSSLSDAQEDVDSKPLEVMSTADVLAWLRRANDDEETIQQPSPLAPTPFKKGVIWGRSMNDVLMIKGLIDPGVYLRYMDLSSFSHH